MSCARCWDGDDVVDADDDLIAAGSYWSDVFLFMVLRRGIDPIVRANVNGQLT